MINRQEIEQRMRRLICEQIGCDAEEIGLGSSILGDLDGEDLDVVGISIAIEDEFALTGEPGNIEVLVSRHRENPTLSEWVDIVLALLAEQAERGPRKTVKAK